MALFTKDPEKERLKQEAADIKAQEDAERAFWVSPQGRAREARQSGAHWLQIALPLSQTERTAMGVITGDHNGVKRTSLGQEETLAAVESEGWALWNAGYVWQQTGSVSRDKLLSSGQVENVTGEIVGIYLFHPLSSS